MSRNSKKIEGGPLGNKFFEKSRTMMKKIQRVDPLVSLGIVYVTPEKKEKPFRFSSLGQRVQYGVFLKFCRTFGRTVLVNSSVSKKKH